MIGYCVEVSENNSHNKSSCTMGIAMIYGNMSSTMETLTTSINLDMVTTVNKIITLNAFRLLRVIRGRSASRPQHLMAYMHITWGDRMA